MVLSSPEADADFTSLTCLPGLPGLKESCSVKAVVDIRKENHDALRTRLNESGLTETKILTTLPEALEALPCKEAQSVLIVTPNTTHAELAEQSLRAGRHLLLEKPIARGLG